MNISSHVKPEDTTLFSLGLMKGSSRKDFFWRSRNGMLWTFGFGGAIILALIAGVLMYRKSVAIHPALPDTGEKNRMVVSQASPTPVTENGENVSYTLSVLNGSGVQREAGRLKEILEADKHTVSFTGNASSQNYKKTRISMKENVSTIYIERLKAILTKIYVLEEMQKLDESKEFDVEVIIGSEKQ